MNPLLTSTFTDEQREQAASIGEYVDLSLVEKIVELFKALPDPLLSASDVEELLGTATLAEVETALKQLVDQQLLEAGIGTQRPFDPSDLELFRAAGQDFGRLIMNALEAQLADGTSRYQFTCDGRLIRSLAEVDRLDAASDQGQQRGEIRKHVEEIAEGIRSGTQIPNSILLTLMEEKVERFENMDDDDTDVPESWTKIKPFSEWLEVFSPHDTESAVQRVRLVEIDFPYRAAAFDEEKTALLVDGQQRTAAVALVSIDAVPRIDLSVNLVITGTDGAKIVFGVANNAKPIPVDFKLGLLASMSDAPGFLRGERVPALATRLLAIVLEDSPFYHLVKYPGFKPAGSTPIAYNSLFQIVRAFVRARVPGRDDPEQLARVVAKAFSLVKAAWNNEWGRRPQETKLMHGAGLRAMAELLGPWIRAEIGNDAEEISDDAWAALAKLLEALKARVAWSADGAAANTKEAATFHKKHVEEKQNTNQDVTKLLEALQEQVDAVAKSAKK